MKPKTVDYYVFCGRLQDEYPEFSISFTETDDDSIRAYGLIEDDPTVIDYDVKHPWNGLHVLSYGEVKSYLDDPETDCDYVRKTLERLEMVKEQSSQLK